jgi:uncharacterized protein
VKFVWDSAKDRSNRRRHGLSFAEARQLFESGEEYLEIYDSEHSDVEDRFIAVGTIDRGTAVVVYTETEEALIRIIGARLANKRERDLYHAQVIGTDE